MAEKPVQTALYRIQKDRSNCGTFVAIYAYHMTIKEHLPKATESEEYLRLFRKFMVSCFLETKQNKEAMLTTLGSLHDVFQCLVILVSF